MRNLTFTTSWVSFLPTFTSMFLTVFIAREGKLKQTVDRNLLLKAADNFKIRTWGSLHYTQFVFCSDSKGCYADPPLGCSPKHTCGWQPSPYAGKFDSHEGFKTGMRKRRSKQASKQAVDCQTRWEKQGSGHLFYKANVTLAKTVKKTS